MLPLTPDGRGQVFTHALFPQRDLDNQRTRYASHSAAAGDGENESDEVPPPAARGAGVPPAKVAAETAAPPRGGDADVLRQTVEELRGTVRHQQDEMRELAAAVKRIEDELHDFRRALGG